MIREEKIAKLRKLGVWEQWESNILDRHGEKYKEYMLNCNEDNWIVFIKGSFRFDLTPEGVDFWGKIQNK